MTAPNDGSISYDLAVLTNGEYGVGVVATFSCDTNFDLSGFKITNILPHENYPLYTVYIRFKYAIDPHALNYFYAAFSYTSYSVPSVSIGIGVTVPIVIIIVVIVVLVCVLTSRRRRLARNMYRISLVNNAASTSVVVTGSTATAYPMQQSMDQKLQYSNQAPPQHMYAPQPLPAQHPAGPLPPALYLSGGEAPPAYPH